MRLRAQAIAGPKAMSPAAAVQRMLALQAQDFEAACWAVGTRTEGATRDDVFAALDSGAIVRSWPMRGTLHFVPPADLRWMLGVTTERMVAGLALRHRRLELEDEHFGTARELVHEALSGGRRISRAELMALWERNGIATGGQRGYHLIYYLAQTGLLCWGPLENGRQSLVLLDEWAPQARALEHDEALAEFFLRYLAGHGPATVKDFVWWTKGTMAGAKIAIAVLGDRIESARVRRDAVLGRRGIGRGRRRGCDTSPIDAGCGRRATAPRVRRVPARLPGPVPCSRRGERIRRRAGRERRVRSHRRRARPDRRHVAASSRVRQGDGGCGSARGVHVDAACATPPERGRVRTLPRHLRRAR